MQDYTLHHGDSLEVLRTFPDNSVDSIITDPPYGLSFMGKRWDYDVPSEDIWRECLRVLKPGGHLLVFAGTRTQHRMAVRIEDAGFEIRDMIAWVYGSGFPKSLDVSKAIDKAGGDALAWRAFSESYAKAVRASNISHADIDRALGVKSSSCYWARTDHRGGMPPRHHWEKVRMLLSLPDDFAKLYDEAEREVVGIKKNAMSGWSMDGTTQFVDRNITAPATDAAKQWQGWGTALKPALEPITVARKPLSGTVAETVLAHGTGAINVDGCRIEGADAQEGRTRHGGGIVGNASSYELPDYKAPMPAGRWPANLIHDGSQEVVGLFPETGKSSGGRIGNKGSALNMMGQNYESGDPGYGDTGSAARFFYCAKASKRDRDEGCEGMEAKNTVNDYRPNDDGTHGLQSRLHESTAKGRNHHPTVKPTDLMRYLCRLVTPPGGIVLDPFMGSGSTGKAAKLEGFSFIGIEREAEYVEIANARIEYVHKNTQLKLT